MNSRIETGIKTLRNGEHRILQMQLDMHGGSLKKIEDKLDALIGADERSKLNFKLICLLFAAIISLSAGIVVLAKGII